MRLDKNAKRGNTLLTGMICGRFGGFVAEFFRGNIKI